MLNERATLPKVLILRLHHLFLFATVYGAVFINYIDQVWPGLRGYHLWLIGMYFMPFVPLLILRGKKDFPLFLALGLYVSLMNDLLWGIWAHFLRGRDLFDYYHKWLVPQNVSLGWRFDGLFITFEVYSWMMALSIYARIVITYVSLKLWLRAVSEELKSKEKKGLRRVFRGFICSLEGLLERG